MTNLHQQTIYEPEIASVPEDWKDRTSWSFASFVLHRQDTTCTNCGMVHTASSVYRMFIRHHEAASDIRLVPATRVPLALGVVVTQLEPRTSPLCHTCVAVPVPGTVTLRVSSEDEFREAIKRDILDRRAAAERKRARDARERASAPKGAATDDEVMSL